MVSSDLSMLSEKRSSGYVGPLDILHVDDDTDVESPTDVRASVSYPSSAGAEPIPQHQEQLLHPGSAARPISIPKSPSRASNLDIEVDEELSNSVSTVESWLRKTHSDQEESTTRPSTPGTTTTTTNTATATTTATTTTATTATTTGEPNEATTITTSASRFTFPTNPFARDTEMIPMPLTAAAKISLLAQTIRRPSHASSVSTMDDDSESDEIPAPIQSVLMTTLNSNRLSRLFEATGSQISPPYFTTKLALSLSDGGSGEQQLQDGLQDDKSSSNNATDGNQGARTSLVADFARNSIRFSEFGLKAPNKALPSIPDSEACMVIEKPLPHRPISMFVPFDTLIPITTEEEGRDDDDGGGNVDDSGIDVQSEVIIVERSATDSPAMQATSSGNSSPAPTARRPNTSPIEVYRGQESATVTSDNRLGVPGTTTARPATICVGSEDPQIAAPAPVAVSVLFTPLKTSSPSAQQQREETTETIAERTARRCFQEDETFLPRDEIAVFLGQAKPFNQLVLRHYMDFFDFSGKRLDGAFRQMCQKLILRGETQEIDRVLEGFAQRYIDCNPESIFGNKDVVHAITYSIMLLNTDLHVVQQSSSSKMSRSAFVKNTLQTVIAQSQREDDERASEDSSTHGVSYTRATAGDSNQYGYVGKKRTPSIKSWRSGASFQGRNPKMGTDPKANGGYGNGKWWMSELESLLKDMYTTVKNNQILLPSTAPTKSTSKSAPNTPTSSAFSIGHPNSNRVVTGGSGFLPRMSKPDATTNFPAGPGSGGIFSALGRRSSMNAKGKQILQRFNAQHEASSSTSPPLPSQPRFGYIDENSSQSSIRLGNSGRGSASTPPPPPSFSSQKSQNVTSPVTGTFPHRDTQGSPAFGASSAQKGSRFRMEGHLFRKHLLERADKKASHRAWRRLLVVLDQGGLSMFRADGQFEDGILFDEIRLQHTITNILPPPGYSSSRRYVFAVQLHSGAVYLFQTATQHDCEDWARTCNYWAARTSKEPLPGGVINMDYGWGRCLDMVPNIPDGAGIPPPTPPHSYTMSSTTSGFSVSTLSSASAPNSSSSITSALTPPSSGRSISTTISEDNEASSAQGGASYLQPPLSSSSTSSALSAFVGSDPASGTSNINSGRASSMKSTSSKNGSGSGAATSLGDRVTLFEWSPPLPTTSMSVLNEEEQCKSLKRYVAGLEADMDVHQEHRVPMMKLFLPKSLNYAKAFNNWERRSRYLLKEMVKYQIYVECLEQSIKFRRSEEQEITDDGESELQHLEVDDDDEHHHHDHDRHHRRSESSNNENIAKNE